MMHHNTQTGNGSYVTGISNHSASGQYTADMQLSSSLQKCPIAIVGMSSMFPDSINVDQYWDLIVRGANAIIDVPPSRWNIDDYYSPDKNAEDKAYCKRGGFLPEIDFDPMEFGLPPNILEVTDVSQMLALVAARDVLNDAGIGEDSDYDRDKVGITLGASGAQKLVMPLMSRLQGPILEKVLAASGVEAADRKIIIDKYKKAFVGWQESAFPGLLSNVIAGRIANRFDLGGINCVVDAACAASMAALKLAVSELLEFRSEVMLTGGICCDNSPFMYMCFSKTPALTDDECVRPFDRDSRGIMIGEGVGMLALKRLADAERDSDRIYAVIRGMGTSSDGRFKSIYAPRPEGQAKALQRAYRDAGFGPGTCGLIEAHGTGTRAGDVAEFKALNTVFGADTDRKQCIALGSVKSQIGHTKTAAGAAGMIKAALALYHKILPATINVEEPNALLDIENTPFYLNTETRPWMPRADGVPRRAGISSFGFGGTNFHVVLEEYQPTASGQYRLHAVPEAVVITGVDERSLVSTVNEWRRRLADDREQQTYVFNALVKLFGLRQTPSAGQARLGFVVKNAAEAIQMLDAASKQFGSKPGTKSWNHPLGLYYRERALSAAGGVVALFPGQGSQYLNMGRELACNFPSVLNRTAAMDEQFSASGGYQLSTISYPIPVFTTEARQRQEDSLRLTQHAQPAIGALSAGIYRTFTDAGFKPDFIAGHSFGELTALWAAGVLSEAGFMALACARGQAMAAQDEPSFDAGRMIAVVGDPQAVAAEIAGISGVTIANYNSSSQVVVAGASKQIVAAAHQLEQQGFNVIALPVSAAFHTPLVGHAQQPFAEAIAKATFNVPAVPVFSNSTAKPYPNNVAEIKKLLANHVLESVRFREQIENIYAAGGRVFVEFGPRNVLTKFVEDILKDKSDVVTIAVNATPKQSSDLQLRQAAVQLAVTGVGLGAVDSYSAVKRLTASKRSPLAMKLSGSNYVSAQTRQAYGNALNDGWTLTPAQPQVVEKALEIDRIARPPGNAFIAPGSADSQQELVSSIERSISQLFDHQQKLLDVHERCLLSSKEYADTVKTVLAAQSRQPELSASLDRTLAMYHQLQVDTLKVHQSFLERQSDAASALRIVDGTGVRARKPGGSATPSTHGSAPPSLSQVTDTAVQARAFTPESIASAPLQPLAEMTPPVLTPTNDAAPIPVEQSGPQPQATVSSVETGAVAEILSTILQVVSEKTGYPTEMLTAEMDMEADLGIDSIKRVEILSAVQERLPSLPQMNAGELAELRTLGQIAGFLQAHLGAPAPAPAQAGAQSSGTAAIHAVAETGAVAEILSTILQVVSEKTGYPTEMLTAEMDMEADLGIDSIKRVEILSAVQERLPSLPQMNAGELAELRTLGQIAGFLQAHLGATIGAEAAAAVNKSSQGPAASLGAIPSFVVKLAALGPITRIDGNVLGQNILVIDDGTGAAATLSSHLIKAGASVAVVHPLWVARQGTSSLHRTVRSAEIADATETGVRSLVGTLAPLDCVIYLQPPLAAPGNGASLQSQGPAKQSLDLAFLLAKYCGIKQSKSARPAFMAITRQGGTFGYGGSAAQSCLETDLVQGGLSGLVKTLAHEWSNVFCRAIDVSPNLSGDKLGAIVLDEMRDANTSLIEVAYDTDGRTALGNRLTLIAEPTDSPNLVAGNALDRTAVLLVSGGAKGVTAHCMVRLARQYRCKFVLLGRSPFGEREPDWARGVTEESALNKQAMRFLQSAGGAATPAKVKALVKPVLDQREIAETLEAISRAGGQARYVALDVTRAEGVTDAVAPAIREFGAITGIVHGAGVLADALIERKTLKQFDAVYQTKVHGLVSLMACVKPQQLKHLVLFSSGAGFYGNEGQADYAMANEILNKFAYRFKALHPATQVLSMNWGPWDGGMVTPELKRMFEQRGVAIMPLDTGAELLLQEMSARDNRCPQILVGTDLSASRKQDAAAKQDSRRPLESSYT